MSPSGFFILLLSADNQKKLNIASSKQFQSWLSSLNERVTPLSTFVVFAVIQRKLVWSAVRVNNNTFLANGKLMLLSPNADAFLTVTLSRNTIGAYLIYSGNIRSPLRIRMYIYIQLIKASIWMDIFHPTEAFPILEHQYRGTKNFMKFRNVIWRIFKL